MSLSKKPVPSWQEALKIVSRCPICSTAYEAEQARFFVNTETARLVHLTCPGCKSYFMAMILMLGQGLSSVGMVTDLSFDDVSRLYEVDSVTVDEVIEGHEFIHNQLFLEALVRK